MRLPAYQGSRLLTCIVLFVSTCVCLAQPAKAVFPGATWQERSPDQAGVSRAKLDAFRQNICGTDPDRSAGCVVKDGYLIYYWGSFNKRHNWASASKPCLSTMLFAAIAEGKVKSVDSPISPWWPELRPLPWAPK